MENPKNLIVYLDTLQRLIVAEQITTTDSTITVKNPIVLHVQSNNGQVNIQFFPVVFKEFLADPDEATTWIVNKSSITLCEKTLLNARLVAQYNHIFSPVKSLPNVMQGPAPIPMGAGTPHGSNNSPVIQLFDN
jgi:hypothetical protein